MAYTDIITFEHVSAQSLESVKDVEQMRGEINPIIADVTGLIEDYLDRPVIVRKTTQLIADYQWNDWEFTDTTDYWWWADAQPVVQTITDNTYVSPYGKRLLADSDDFDAYEYFGGYRRSDQVLSGAGQGEEDLPVGTGEELDGLTTLPDVVPKGIRNVATRLVLYFLSQVRSDTLGRRTISQTIGDGNVVTIEALDRGFVAGELKKLDQYKRGV